MSLNVTLTGEALGTTNKTTVTPLGQMVTAPLAYNDSYFVSLEVDDTAFNIIEPVAGKQFIIDGLLITGERTIASSGADVAIFEATSPTSGIPSRELFNLSATRLSNLPLTGLNIKTSKGIWINATTDSATVNITLFGYYVPVVMGE